MAVFQVPCKKEDKMPQRIFTKFIKVCCYTVLIVFSQLSLASDFNLPFINASGLGNVYAGWAAEAEDASTAYANPAGLTRIHQQQFVASALELFGATQFTGTTTPPFPPFAPQTGKVSSRLSAPLPSFYYAIPLAKNFVFAIGQTTPWGLGSNYIKDSLVRYSATRSQIVAIDFGPSIGFKLTPQLSLGFGLDIERLSLTFHNIIGAPPFLPDFESHNDLAGWGYGWHGGLLYEITPCTRVGFSYNSQVVFQTNGVSKLYSPLLPNGKLDTDATRLNMTLPELAQLSLYHEFNRRWAVMGTIFYTGWNVFEKGVLENVMTPTGQASTITIPFNYHTTFDYALGASFKATEKWTLRTGIEWLNAPTNDTDRIVADPMGDATIVGIGAHYQQNCRLGYDIGFAHAFCKQAPLNHVTPFGSEFGYSAPETSVIGIQVTWNKVNNRWIV